VAAEKSKRCHSKDMSSTAPVVDSVAARTHGLYIGGEWVETSRQDEVKLPYDGSVVGLVAHAEDRHVEMAVQAAERGASAMASLANHQRAELLLRLAAEVKKDEPDLTERICAETGKPVKEARIEASRSVDTLIAAAHEARQLHGEVVPMDFAAGAEGRLAMTLREPLGVIGAITPFNFPLNLTLHKLAPALAGGNAVVHKPAERTPLSALRLAELVSRAGAPKGAYNVITGDGPALAQAMLRNPVIAMMTFTGSVQVGTELRARAGLKRMTLELGNNSAAIIEPDADLDTAIKRSVQGAFGQRRPRGLLRGALAYEREAAVEAEALVRLVRRGARRTHERVAQSVTSSSTCSTVRPTIDHSRRSGSSSLVPTIRYSVPGQAGSSLSPNRARLMSVSDGIGSERVCEW